MKKFKKPLTMMLTLILLLSNNISTMAQQRDGPSEQFAMYWRPIEENRVERFTRPEEESCRTCPQPRSDQTQEMNQRFERPVRGQRGLSRDERRRDRRTPRTRGHERGYQIPEWVLDVQPYLDDNERYYLPQILAEGDWYNEWDEQILLTTYTLELERYSFVTYKYVVLYDRPVSIFSNYVVKVIPIFLTEYNPQLQIATLNLPLDISSRVNQFASGRPIGTTGATIIHFPPHHSYIDYSDRMFIYPPISPTATGRHQLYINRFMVRYRGMEFEAICTDHQLGHPGGPASYQVGAFQNFLALGGPLADVIRNGPHNNPCYHTGDARRDARNNHITNAMIQVLAGRERGVDANLTDWAGNSYDVDMIMQTRNHIADTCNPEPMIILPNGESSYTRYVSAVPGQTITETITIRTSRRGNNGGDGAHANSLLINAEFSGPGEATLGNTSLSASGLYLSSGDTVTITIPEPREPEGCVTIEISSGISLPAGPLLIRGDHNNQDIVLYIPTYSATITVCWGGQECPPDPPDTCSTPPTRQCPDGSIITAVWTRREGVPENLWCTDCWEWPECPNGGVPECPPDHPWYPTCEEPPPDDCPDCCPRCTREDYTGTRPPVYFNYTRTKLRWNNVPVAFAETKVGAGHNQFGTSTGSFTLPRPPEHFEAMMGVYTKISYLACNEILVDK